MNLLTVLYHVNESDLETRKFISWKIIVAYMKDNLPKVTEQIDDFLAESGLKVGEKVFDLFEYEGKPITPEEHPCFDPNQSTFIHNSDGSVTNTADDLSYRMNCFSSRDLKDKFVNDHDKEDWMERNENKYDEIKRRGYYESSEEINDCIIYVDVKNKTDTTDHGSLTLEINSLLHKKFAGGKGGCSYHFTVEKNGKFGLEKELVHAEYEQEKHSGDNAKGKTFDKKKRFQYVCIKKFIDKKIPDRGIALEIWAKYPGKAGFVKVQDVEDKHNWYRSPPDYKGDKIIKMNRIHPDFRDGEAITWGGPLGVIIKGGGDKKSDEELRYTFYDFKVWRLQYE